MKLGLPYFRRDRRFIVWADLVARVHEPLVTVSPVHVRILVVKDELEGLEGCLSRLRELWSNAASDEIGHHGGLHDSNREDVYEEVAEHLL